MKKAFTFSLSSTYRWSIPALLCAFAVFFYWKVLFTSSVMLPWDAADFFYPYLSFVHEELRHFRLPLWNPFVMSGYPIIGDMEAQIFYPINWLFVLLSPSSPLPFRLVEIQLVLHFFLAGLFMFYLARDVTGETAPALFGGLLFMSSGAMVAHTQHMAIVNSMAWYPLVFLVARRALLNGRVFWTIAAGMLFGIQLLAGHWQHSAYLGLLLFLYFACRACFGSMRSLLWPRWILQLLAIAAIGTGLALVQILPGIELGFRSVRSQLTYWDITSGNPPQYLWTLFLPNIFGGLSGAPLTGDYDLSLVYVFLTVPGLLLALVGIAETARHRNFYYPGTLLLLIFLSFGWHGPLGEVLYAIPVLNRFRNPGMFFDAANFLLCLMAALGAKVLFSRKSWPSLNKYLPWILAALLALAAASDVVWRFGIKIHGWYGMVGVLALFSLVAVAFLHRRLGRNAALGAVIALLVFQLICYNMNQRFSWSLNDPGLYATRDYALGSSGLLRFLRSDPTQDFRVGAIAEFILSGNGWNVWRIPAIFGWNPITLQSYQNYIQEFTQPDDYTAPRAGGDHELGSPMLDLLGTKYFISVGQETGDSLGESEKFRRVYTDSEWWHVYENKDYLSRAWFYPRAYTLPDKALPTALMKSHWFHARSTLLLSPGQMPAKAAQLTEELFAIHVLPDRIEAASRGRAAADPACAQPQMRFGYWNGTGSWVRFDVGEAVKPGRYTVLVQYASATPDPAPAIETMVESGGRQSTHGPVILPRTRQWYCASLRTAELGQFDLAPGVNKISLTLRRDTPVDLYSLWLVRLPDTVPPASGSFSFHDFSYATNRISLVARIPTEGFVLLNETFYPGWEATVDGQPATIYQADGIFRALWLTGGEHRIELRFRPRYLLAGAAVSLLTLFCCLAFAARSRNRGRSKTDPPAAEFGSAAFPG